MKVLRFESKQEEVRNIELHQLPAHRTTCIQKAIKTGTGNTVLLGKNGKLYITNIYSKSRFGAIKRWEQARRSGVLSPLEACVKLGVLSESAFSTHKRDIAALALKEERQMYASILRQMAADYGFRVTKEQMKKLEF